MTTTSTEEFDEERYQHYQILGRKDSYGYKFGDQLDGREYRGYWIVDGDPEAFNSEEEIDEYLNQPFIYTVEYFKRVGVLVNPAHAGMIPEETTPADDVNGKPRARGDDPQPTDNKVNSNE